jgi:hypothetical protein
MAAQSKMAVYQDFSEKNQETAKKFCRKQQKTEKINKKKYKGALC